MIFRSDRTGSWQIYAYDIAGRRVRRLTDAAADPGRPSIDQWRPLLYYTQGDFVHRLNVETLEETVVYRHPTPAGGTFLLMDLSSDGQYLGFMEIGPYDKLDNKADDFVRRVLGSLSATRTGETYLETLRQLSANAYRVKPAAAALSVHPHTLTYRVKQIRHRFGLDLDDPEVRLRVQLALLILDA